MRTLSLISAGLVALFVSLPGLAQEDSEQARVQQAQQTQHIHALGKRPYQAVVAKTEQADQTWVGATLRVEGADVHQPMRMHQLGKRGF